mmetsp:Transcript_130488/g.225643  ORF Transcript_130488/g.225643 Transcript_130488/m.225643 type:complete len:233 (-) Transcript_130488:965-1663(-)
MSEFFTVNDSVLKILANIDFLILLYRFAVLQYQIARLLDGDLPGRCKQCPDLAWSGRPAPPSIVAPYLIGTAQIGKSLHTPNFERSSSVIQVCHERLSLLCDQLFGNNSIGTHPTDLNEGLKFRMRHCSSQGRQSDHQQVTYPNALRFITDSRGDCSSVRIVTDHPFVQLLYLRLWRKCYVTDNHIFHHYPHGSSFPPLFGGERLRSSQGEVKHTDAVSHPTMTHCCCIITI